MKKEKLLLPFLMGSILSEQDNKGIYEYTTNHFADLPNITYTGNRPYSKGPMSKKQIKARNKSKMAKKSRKTNRK